MSDGTDQLSQWRRLIDMQLDSAQTRIADLESQLTTAKREVLEECLNLAVEAEQYYSIFEDGCLETHFHGKGHRDAGASIAKEIRTKLKELDGG